MALSYAVNVMSNRHPQMVFFALDGGMYMVETDQPLPSSWRFGGDCSGKMWL